MAHPNGWGTREQGVLRTAAVAAGLSTLSDSHRRISFVSEAEASIQYCLTSSQTSSLLLVRGIILFVEYRLIGLLSRV